MELTVDPVDADPVGAMAVGIGADVIARILPDIDGGAVAGIVAGMPPGTVVGVVAPIVPDIDGGAVAGMDVGVVAGIFGIANC